MILMESPTCNIEKFKKDVINHDISIDRLVQKYLIFGTPYIFKDDEEKYYVLKEIVSKSLSVSISCITVVGSCKLGFSLKPTKLWEHISEESDIDIALINPELFDTFWKEFYEINSKLQSRTEEQDKNYQSFLNYFFRGWLRIDLFPYEYAKKKTVSELTRQLFSIYGRKASLGIFRNEFFFESYHKENLNKIREIEYSKYFSKG